MNGKQFDNELNTFALYRHAFALGELLDFSDSEDERQKLRDIVAKSPHFIYLGQGNSGEELVIPTATLHQWFIGLTIRLASAKRARLSKEQLASRLNSLRVDGRWELPPMATIQYGQRFGFLGPAWSTGQYVFPIAHVLSFIPLTGSLELAITTALEGLAEAQKPPSALGAGLDSLVQEALSKLSPKERYVLQAREGILSQPRQTLEDIGISFGVTRERVRQIEEKGWKKLRHPGRQRKIVEAILHYLFGRHGSLIVATASPETSLIKFVARCIDLPYVEVPNTGLAILGASPENVAALQSHSRFPADIDANLIAARWESESRICLVATDLIATAQAMAQSRRKALTKEKKVYLALKQIGKPAHYSKVCDVYNSMFPDQPSIENNIHAVLSREAHGVVWIGLHGTFALKEWGYERPSIGLFEAVVEIVDKGYKQTGKPVPFPVIGAEIGKYRKVVQPHSLVFATHLNPRLQRVGKDSFIPRGPTDQVQHDISAAELDSILQEFEQGKTK